MAHDVFISYSNKDKPVADAVCAKLEAAGVRCWIAPRDIQPSQDWGEAIVEGLEGGRVFVLVFSDNANQSKQVKREVERAVSKGLSVLPLRIDSVVPSKAMEYFLSMPHWLDAIAPPLEQHLEKLVATVQSLLGVPGAVAAALDPVPSNAPAASVAVRKKPGWLVMSGVAVVLATTIAGILVYRGRAGHAPVADADLRAARDAYTARVAEAGGDLLGQYGGDGWAMVREQAARAEAEKDKASAAAGYRHAAEALVGVQKASLLAKAKANDGPASRPALVSAANALLAMDAGNAEARALLRKADLYDPAWWVRCAAAGGPLASGEAPPPSATPPQLSVLTCAGLAILEARLGEPDQAHAMLETGAHAEECALVDYAGALAEEGVTVDVEPLVALIVARFRNNGDPLNATEVERERNLLYFAIFKARLRAGDGAAARAIYDAHPPHKEADNPQLKETWKWEWLRLLAPVQAKAGDKAGYELTLRQLRAEAAGAGAERPKALRAIARIAARAEDLAGLEQAIKEVGQTDPETNRFVALWDVSRAALWWATAGDKERAADALKRFDAITKLDPDPLNSRDQHCIAALAHARIGDFPSASEVLRPLIRDSSAAGRIVSALVDLAVSAGQIERAFETLYVLDPKIGNRLAYTKVAIAAASAGRRDVYDRAVGALRIEAAASPSDTHLYLAQALLAGGERDEARKILIGSLRQAGARMRAESAKEPDIRANTDLTGPVAAVMAMAGMWDGLPAQIAQVPDPDDRARACAGVARTLLAVRHPSGKPVLFPAADFRPEYAGWLRPVGEIDEELDD